MQFHECGKSGRPDVLLLQDDDAPVPLTEQLLSQYHFIVPQGKRKTSDEIVSFMRQRRIGQLEAICGTAPCWQVTSQVNSRVHSEKMVAECDQTHPGSLILPSLEEYAEPVAVGG